MLFDLSNASTTFIRMMNQVLKPLIWKLIVMNFDDIRVYSHSEEDHIMHLREVLIVLQKNNLNVNMKKYNFMSRKLLFLEYMISA